MDNSLITIEEIERLAEMSALNFTPEEKEKLIGEVGGIVSMLDQCGEIKTDAIETHRRFETLQGLREDKFIAGLDPNYIFNNAPSEDNCYFVVPEVDNGF